MIIGIEGIDSSGKATQARMLAHQLDALMVSLPAYETVTGKLVLQFLKDELATCAWIEDYGPREWFPDDQSNARALQALMVANRLEVLPRINDALAAKRPVVLDRWTLSGVVYGALDGLDPAWLAALQASLPEPDVWVLLDVPVEESFARRPERRDRYERDAEKLKACRASYLDVFRSIGQPKCWVVDGVGDPRDIHQAVLEAVVQGAEAGAIVADRMATAWRKKTLPSLENAADDIVLPPSERPITCSKCGLVMKPLPAWTGVKGKLCSDCGTEL